MKLQVDEICYLIKLHVYEISSWWNLKVAEISNLIKLESWWNLKVYEMSSFDEMASWQIDNLKKDKLIKWKNGDMAI